MGSSESKPNIKQPVKTNYEQEKPKPKQKPNIERLSQNFEFRPENEKPVKESEEKEELKTEELFKNKCKKTKSKKQLLEFKNHIQTQYLNPNKSNPHNPILNPANSKESPTDQIKPGRSGITLERLMIGEDRRTALSFEKSSLSPYCSIGKIEFYSNIKGRKYKFLGTGTLIGPNIVLTCAHNVYDPKSKSESFDLEFFPAFNEGRSETRCKVVKFKYPEEYKKYDYEDPNQILHDYAVLFLDRNLENSYGYLGIKIFPENKDLQVSLYGYSEDKKEKLKTGYNLIGMEGSANVTGSIYSYTEIDTLQGQSGSALFLQENGDYLIAGIHSNSDEGPNKAVKITSDVFERIKSWTAVETYSLDLSSNKIGDREIEHILSKNLYLEKLNLSNCQIGAEVIQRLSEMNLVLLKKLDLSWNNIGDEGMKHLARLKLPKLLILNLWSNEIELEGIKLIATMNLLKLQTLNLGGNKIGKEEIKHLSEMNFPRLQEIYLSGNEITEESEKILKLSKPNLKIIH